MYKVLLCWRYLRTRWIALASVISVTLGVATMIVVNAVMSGFSHEMEARIRGAGAELTLEAHSLEGFANPDWHKEQILKLVGDKVEAMSSTVMVPAMLSYQIRGQWINRQINLIGIDEETAAAVSDFSKYLQHPANRQKINFKLRENGYDTRDHQVENGPERAAMDRAGWQWRRVKAQRDKELDALKQGATAAAQPALDAGQNAFADRDARAKLLDENGDAPTPDTVNAEPKPEIANSPAPDDPFRKRQPTPEQAFDAATQQYTGAFVGIGMVAYRDHSGNDHLLSLPGDDVKITFPTAGQPPKAVSDTFTICDFYESKMSEYDSQVVFVPIRKLQELRGMIDPTTGVANVNAIQIKLKDEKEALAVRDILRKNFPAELYGVYTWRDKQNTLLQAVATETVVLNILLFMIIAVAGFGILAIFFMIVVEKTKDIGILKSLGASSRGVMGIFLGYGLSLGIVGAGCGLIAGLAFVQNINIIRGWVEYITGQPVFDPAVYYFQKIPTIIDPFTVGWIVGGALLIAVLASVLPARRAARLQPVEALRYE